MTITLKSTSPPWATSSPAKSNIIPESASGKISSFTNTGSNTNLTDGKTSSASNLATSASTSSLSSSSSSSLSASSSCSSALSMSHSPLPPHPNSGHLFKATNGASSTDALFTLPVLHEFRWKHGGTQVFLTGSFDNWKCSIPLIKDSSTGVFSTLIYLQATQKHLFKFVVDNVWRCSLDFPTEVDPQGNVNNVLVAMTPQELVAAIKERCAPKIGPNHQVILPKGDAFWKSHKRSPSNGKTLTPLYYSSLYA